MKTLNPLFVSLFLILTACSGPSIQKFQGMTQGTSYHISYWSESPVDAAAIKKAVEAELERIDQLLSNYRDDSVIEQFNKNRTTEAQETDSEIIDLIRIAQSVHKESQGCYDLTIKPFFELWGFREDVLAIPSDEQIQLTLARSGLDKLKVIDDTHLQKLHPELTVDVSSIAQGYTVETVSHIFEAQGIKHYLVEIGGELKTNGHKPDQQAWRIAVERPVPGKQTVQKIITTPKDLPTAIMTSGTYRHYFDADGKRYSHILDARTGRPVTHDLVSVTVIHPNPTIADAWSTALLCMGQEEGLKAANAQKLSALFIEQKDDKLIETQSEFLDGSIFSTAPK
ncbi:MAG: FAD:protein FMN transferase [Methylicorpusculum sp.]|uniref:FAD:protein FMN transferase n=1 Tax=Methylicorpusculum sp. TaxID=2713644 RepID=UPI002722E960|nr:FAD:protein FMN transferase [Methylicorpusculum sp.]MDO8937600.1 FAD:protein FMN transferase [Methylicorpusculum sp.]MDP2203740.1 FAD:protein FMN transferase [Methylicorpusculum sp.]